MNHSEVTVIPPSSPLFLPVCIAYGVFRVAKDQTESGKLEAGSFKHGTRTNNTKNQLHSAGLYCRFPLPVTAYK